MNKQNLQLLNIEVDTFRRADSQLTSDMRRELFEYDRTSELNELKHDDPDFLQLTNLIEENHHVVLTYLLPDKIRNLKALPKEDKARLNTTKDTKIVVYRYIPVFDINQTSGEPVLTAGDSAKDHLITNHENITALYNEFKGYLSKNTDLKVSEELLTGLDRAEGYFRKDTNETVIGDDEPDSQLKLRTLCHEFAHSRLHGLNAECNNRSRPCKETQARAVAYIAMQNIGIDTGECSLGYVATWAKDKEIIHNTSGEVQSVSKKAIDITDELTQKLGLQEEQRESSSLKAETEQEATPKNKQPANNNNKPLSDRIQAQLNGFVKQNPDMKRSEQEQAQELRT